MSKQCNARRSLAALTLVLGAAWAATGADARPQTVRIVLNPTRDTFLGQGVGAAQDTAAELQTGWVYTTRGREFRSYLEFPLDPARHPADGLVGAQLWLYPEEEPRTSQIAATFVVRTMAEPFAEGRVAPSWFAAGDPSVEMMIDRTMDWKTFEVRELVAEMLRAPDQAHGFEISGKEMRDDTRWDFLSREADSPYPEGKQPRLILFFRDDALPSPTTGTTPTASPSATPPPDTATPTAQPPPTATPAPTRPSSPTPTRVPETPALYLPRTLRDSA